MTRLAAKFRVKPEDIDKRTTEMISSCAYMARTGQREGKARMIDFLLHARRHFLHLPHSLDPILDQHRGQGKASRMEYCLDLIW